MFRLFLYESNWRCLISVRLRPTVRQVQFVYFIVFGSRRRITFGAMDHAPAGKRKRGAVSAPNSRSWKTRNRKLSYASVVPHP